MSKSTRWVMVVVVLLLLLVVVLLLLGRCQPAPLPPSAASVPTVDAPAKPTEPIPAAAEIPEVLSPAALQLPPRVAAGAGLSVVWTGPNNRGDFVTFVRRDQPDSTTGSYELVSKGSPLALTAPIEAARIGNCVTSQADRTKFLVVPP